MLENDLVKRLILLEAKVDEIYLLAPNLSHALGAIRDRQLALAAWGLVDDAEEEAGYEETKEGQSALHAWVWRKKQQLEGIERPKEEI